MERERDEKEMEKQTKLCSSKQLWLKLNTFAVCLCSFVCVPVETLRSACPVENPLIGVWRGRAIKGWLGNTHKHNRCTRRTTQTCTHTRMHALAGCCVGVCLQGADVRWGQSLTEEAQWRLEHPPVALKLAGRRHSEEAVAARIVEQRTREQEARQEASKWETVLLKKHQHPIHRLDTHRVVAWRRSRGRRGVSRRMQGKKDQAEGKRTGWDEEGGREVGKRSRSSQEEQDAEEKEEKEATGVGRGRWRRTGQRTRSREKEKDEERGEMQRWEGNEQQSPENCSTFPSFLKKSASKMP